MRIIKYILLPILGILAAIIAFRLAAPYEFTLNRPNMNPDDPRAVFTWGTKWGEVNRIAFGALLCGPLAVVLALGRRSALNLIIAGVIGTVLGGVVNFATDSAADIIGITLDTKRAGGGPLVAMLAWCVLVPAGIALTLVLAQGPTFQRIRRAVYALKYAIIASVAVQFCGGALAAQEAEGAVNLQSQIPVWRMVEIAVGLAFGVTILAADEFWRVGTVRLLHGKNEYVDWSLDHAVTRLGSAEGCEVYVRGFQGVEAVHALIIKQKDHFILDPRAPTLVNGAAVGQTTLASRDVITVGNAQLVFSTSSVGAYSYAPAKPIYLTGQAHSKVLQDGAGRQIPLMPGRYGVGTDMTNAFCLQFDQLVAPNHAEIIVSDTGITVTDLRSATGTKRNGTPIHAPTTLNIGDTLEIGVSKFTYIS